MTPEEHADMLSVWNDVATRYPDFKQVHDISCNYHAVREIVLGGSVTWKGFHERFKPFAGARIMDIGANVGIFTAFCALAGAWVMAYEPHPLLYPMLMEMIKNAGLRRATALQKPVWTETRKMKYLGFKSPGSDCTRYNGSMPSNGISWTPDDYEKAIDLECVSLDDAIGNLVDWDCVKIDIEGAECEILLAASDAALRRVKFMFVEFHPWVAQGLHDATIERLSSIFKFEGVYRNALGRWDGAYLTREA